jgi:choline dehydrogenase-like flavoprotein
MNFSTSERRIFSSIASTLVGEPAGDAVVDAALPFIRRLRPLDQVLLHGLLRGIEYGAPVFTGSPHRFTRMPSEKQEAYLRGWAESRIELRRQGIASLKALIMIAYYGREEAWDAVGYDGPWLGRVDVPVLPAPDLRSTDNAPRPSRTHTKRNVEPGGQSLSPGVIAGRDLPKDSVLRAQVCVIGTGAGGAAALARLAERGVDVIAVEAGPYTTAKDFTQRELEMLPLLYREAGLRTTSNKAIAILQGTGVGGSTLHNTGLIYPTPEGIAERWRQEHGFPLDPQTLERYVAEAVGSLRSVPIPLDRINENNDALRRGAEALGWGYRIPLHNRLECLGCGYCMLGCAYNRKSNAALTYLPRAVAAGARILSDAPVTRIDGKAGARRVVCQLKGADGTSTGGRVVVEAPVVIIAAGALDSPALLLRSGLGNGRIGRGLRLHPAAMVSGVFPEPIRSWRGLPQSVIVEEFASFFEDGRGGFLILPSASNWPGMTAAVVSGMGAEHRSRMREHPYVASSAVLLHDETEGRVTTTRDGQPVAQYWPNSGDLEELRRGVEAAARVYFAAGARRVYLPYADAPVVRSEAELRGALAKAHAIPHRISLNAVHPQGSCRLGSDSKESTADPHGEVWGAPGVYVADGSLFPTSVGVPPQVTIMALATAVADHVVDTQH